MSTPLATETLDALRGLDTCTVADAIECFGLRLRNEGFTDGTIHCRLPSLPPVVGYAVTLRVRSSSPNWKNQNYIDRPDWWSQIQHQPAPRILVIEDVDRQPGTGAFVGKVHATILKKLGCVGALTNGAVRDLPEMEQLGFGLFSGSVAVSHAYMHIIEIGGPVTVGHLKIQPGDLLHGNRHGVVQIPLHVATRIPKTVAHIKQHQQTLMDFCTSPDFSLGRLEQMDIGHVCPPADEA